MQFPTACNNVRKALTPKGICLLSTQCLLPSIAGAKAFQTGSVQNSALRHQGWQECT